MRGGAAAVALVALAVPLRAEGQKLPRARLTYEREDAGDRCPEEQALRDLVAGRLGRDPFDPNAATSVRVGLLVDDETMVARVELRDGDGDSLGTQRLRAPASQCGDLLSAVATAIAVALDPASGVVPRPREQGAEASSRDERERASKEAEPAQGDELRAAMRVPNVAGPAGMGETERGSRRSGLRSDDGRPWRLAFALGPTAALGRMPDAAPGGVLAAWMGRPRYELGLQAGIHASAGTVRLDGSSVRFLEASLSVLGCVRVEPAAICGVAGVALFEARSADREQGPARTAIPRGGARARVRWRPVDSFGVSAWVQVDVPVVQPSLRVGGEPVWSAPPVTGTFGLAAIVFP